METEEEEDDDDDDGSDEDDDEDDAGEPKHVVPFGVRRVLPLWEDLQERIPRSEVSSCLQLV